MFWRFDFRQRHLFRICAHIIAASLYGPPPERNQLSHAINFSYKDKGKGSSLVIAPCTYNPGRGAFTTSEVAADWHWLYSTAAQASGYLLPALTDFGPAVMPPAGILRPINHARPSPHNPCTYNYMDHCSFTEPRGTGWMAELAVLADR